MSEAFSCWDDQICSIINLEEVRKPLHPFNDISPVVKVTNEHLKLLKIWGNCVSVRDIVRCGIIANVGISIKDAIWYGITSNIGADVRNMIWYTFLFSRMDDELWQKVWYGIGESVWDSVVAYIGSLFNIWPKNVYPYSSSSALWRAGLVPSYDGEIWRLHSGPKGLVIWQGVL